MNDAQTKELCLALMRADTEAQVVRLLSEVGFWNDSSLWRYYGDYENNFNTIGNQQSRPDAALVEKLVNSVDARLMNECLVWGIDPEGPLAPRTLRFAVAQFFEDSTDPESSVAGRMSEWSNSKRTSVARGITLSATGATAREGNPSLTISDCGEGQTPEMLPETLLSLVVKSNKLRIPFVQGKFNMGGTGVLQFCGRHNLQLVVSKRNPEIVKRHLAHESDRMWGLTVVRREDPEGNRRNSVYTYLAPLDAVQRPRRGGILRFSADTLPIFPSGRDAYARECKWGTLIKLYEYAATGHKTHMLLKDGLLRRIDLLLPEVALPMRLHECRAGYKGHEGSPETTLTGLGVRLEDDKAENIESGFPSSCSMSAAGEQMTATVYAFKKGRAETYRKNEGVIFIVNGQTHGYLTADFFRRKQVGLSYLSDSVLVTVDCSKFTGRAREDLFMNSRDRLRGGDLRVEVEASLEELLRHHQGLRDLKERRRREEIEAKLHDSKPLEDVLKSLLQDYPSLSALFLKGCRASNPFKTVKVIEQDKEFQGEQFPTYFKFKGKDYGTELQRECHINMRCRISFETDAANDYFNREIDPGVFSLSAISKAGPLATPDYSLNLQNGIATLSVKLPVSSSVGDELCFTATVSDCSRVDPFQNKFRVSVKERTEPRGEHDGRRKPPSQTEGGDREIPSGIQLPKIVRVFENDWQTQTPTPFTQYTALRVKNTGGPDENSNQNGDIRDVYDFFVNMDNVFLKTELKSSNRDPELTRARFVYGLVLLGLGLLQDEAYPKKSVQGHDEELLPGGQADETNIENRVESFSQAVAPVLLPIIESLGSLKLEDIPTGIADAIGEAT